MSFNLKKNFKTFGGTSVVTPELLRDDSTLTDTLNIDMYDNYGLSKRRGEELVEKFEGQGRIAYTMSNGDKIIVRKDSDAIIKIQEFDIIVQYTGTEEMRIEVGQEYISDLDNKYIKFYKDDIEVARYSLGGESPLSSKTVSDLLSEINVTDLSIFADSEGISKVSTTPAYTIKPFNSVIVDGINDRIYFEAFETVPGTSIPDLGSISEVPSDAIERDGILYFTTRSGLYKYDGTSYYKAGLPKPEKTIVPVPVGYTGSNPKRYSYRVIYTYTDALGNVIESTPSDDLSITVDDATTFPNGIRAIDITGPSLSDYPSNVTYTVLRTKANGSIFFVVAEGLDPSVDFVDTVDDEDLVSDYTLPPFELIGDTNGAYIDIWRNSLVLTGFLNDPDKVVYEDIQYTEGFSDSNSFLTQSRRGGDNTGIMSQDNGLYIFKEDSIFLVTGDLNTSQFQVDKISEEGIGAVSNLSIIESGGRVWFMSKEGIYSISLDGLREESGDLRPIFEKETRDMDLSSCIGFNNTLDGRLLFTVPKKYNDGPSIEQYLVEKPLTYVYNIELQKWFIWDTIDFSRGISINGDEIWYLGSSLDDSANNCEYCRIPRTFTSIDFSDRGLPISSICKSNWETLGEPSVNKKFVRMKVYSIDNSRQRFETPDFTIDIETEHGYKYDEVISKASLRFYELNDPSDDTIKTPIHSRRVRLLAKKTKALRYILKNSELNKNILISGVEFEIALEHSGFMRSE